MATSDKSAFDRSNKKEQRATSAGAGSAMQGRCTFKQTSASLPTQLAEAAQLKCTEHNSTVLICDLCGKGFGAAHNLETHIENTTGRSCTIESGAYMRIHTTAVQNLQYRICSADANKSTAMK